MNDFVRPLERVYMNNAVPVPEVRHDETVEKNAVISMAPWVYVKHELPLGYSWKRSTSLPLPMTVVQTIETTDLPPWLIEITESSVHAPTYEKYWRPSTVNSAHAAIKVDNWGYLLPVVEDPFAVDLRNASLNEARNALKRGSWNYAPLIRRWEAVDVFTQTGLQPYILLNATHDEFIAAGGTIYDNMLIVLRPWKIAGFASLHHYILYESTIYRPVCDAQVQELRMIETRDVLHDLEAQILSSSVQFVTALYENVQSQSQQVLPHIFDYRAEGKLYRLQSFAPHDDRRYRAVTGQNPNPPQFQPGLIPNPFKMRPRQILCSNMPCSLDRCRNDPASAASWTTVLRAVAELTDDNSINILHIITGSLGPTTNAAFLRMRMEYAMNRSQDLMQFFALQGCTTRVFDAHMYSELTHELSMNAIQAEYVNTGQRLTGRPFWGRMQFFSGSQADCKRQISQFLAAHKINLIFFEGGNTHWLLHRLRGSGFDDVLTDYDYFVGGSSAGSNVQGMHIGCQAYKCRYAGMQNCDPLYDAPMWDSYITNTTKTCTNDRNCEWNALEFTNRAHFCHYDPVWGQGIRDMYIRYPVQGALSRFNIMSTYAPRLLADYELVASDHLGHQLQVPNDANLQRYDHNIREARRINAALEQFPVAQVQF